MMRNGWRRRKLCPKRRARAKAAAGNVPVPVVPQRLEQRKGLVSYVGYSVLLSIIKYLSNDLPSWGNGQELFPR
jgi:hypothetical protein